MVPDEPVGKEGGSGEGGREGERESHPILPPGVSEHELSDCINVGHLHCSPGAEGAEVTQPPRERERPVLEKGSLDGLIGIRPQTRVEELFRRQTVKHTLTM